MNTLQLSALPLKKFNFSRTDRLLIAEASDFGPARDGRWWLQRLFNDAADVGIAVASELTGKTEVFYLETIEERDGDLLAWHFKPVNQLANVNRVTIIND